MEVTVMSSHKQGHIEEMSPLRLPPSVVDQQAYKGEEAQKDAVEAEFSEAEEEAGQVDEEQDADTSSEEESEDELEHKPKKQTFVSGLTGGAQQKLAFCMETPGNFSVVDCDVEVTMSHLQGATMLKNCYAAIPYNYSKKGMQSFTRRFGKLFEKLGFQKPARSDPLAELALWILPKYTDAEKVSLDTTSLAITRVPRHGDPGVMEQWLATPQAAEPPAAAAPAAADPNDKEPEAQVKKNWFLEKHYAHLVG